MWTQTKEHERKRHERRKSRLTYEKERKKRAGGRRRAVWVKVYYADKTLTVVASSLQLASFKSSSSILFFFFLSFLFYRVFFCPSSSSYGLGERTPWKGILLYGVCLKSTRGSLPYSLSSHSSSSCAFSLFISFLVSIYLSPTYLSIFL